MSFATFSENPFATKPLYVKHNANSLEATAGHHKNLMPRESYNNRIWGKRERSSVQQYGIIRIFLHAHVWQKSKPRDPAVISQHKLQKIAEILLCGNKILKRQMF